MQGRLAHKFHMFVGLLRAEMLQELPNWQTPVWALAVLYQRSHNPLESALPACHTNLLFRANLCNTCQRHLMMGGDKCTYPKAEHIF